MRTPGVCLGVDGCKSWLLSGILYREVSSYHGSSLAHLSSLICSLHFAITSSGSMVSIVQSNPAGAVRYRRALSTLELAAAPLYRIPEWPSWLPAWLTAFSSFRRQYTAGSRVVTARSPTIPRRSEPTMCPSVGSFAWTPAAGDEYGRSATARRGTYCSHDTSAGTNQGRVGRGFHEFGCQVSSVRWR